MADNILNIKVKFGGEEAVKGTQEVSNSVEKMGNKINESNKKIVSGNDGTKKSFEALSTAVKGFFALAIANKIISYLYDTIDAAKKAQSSFIAFSSIVSAKSISMADAMKVVGEISKEGAISVSETQQAMQNLLQRGYSVNQAKEALDVLRNSAAFGKASHLAFGEAIVTATEGLRQENSILVDNAGITTNVAKMWENYAKSIGVTTESLSQNQKIEAELRGIRAEGLVHMGNYEKMLSTVAGQEAKLNAEFTKSKETIGTQLLPAYNGLIGAGIKLLNVTSFLVTEFKQFGLSSVFKKDLEKLQSDYNKGIINTEQFHKKMNKLRETYLKEYDKINEEASGANKLDPTDKQAELAKLEEEKRRLAEEKRLAERTPQQVWDDTNKENEKALQEAIEYDKKVEALKIQETENEVENLKNQKLALETSLEKKLISYADYAKKAKEILSSIDEKEGKVIAYKVTQLEEKSSIPGLTDEQRGKVTSEINSLKTKRLEGGLNRAKEITSINKGPSADNKLRDAKKNYNDQLASNEANAFRNRSKNEIQLNQEKLDDFLISYEDFFKNKEDLVKKSFDFEIGYLQKQKKEIEAMKPANEEERFEHLTKIAKISGEIADVENNKLNAIKEINREQEKHNKLKAQTLALMEIELDKARKEAYFNGESDKVNVSVNLGLIGHEQAIQAQQYFADEKYAIEKESLEKSMALYAEGSSEYENYLNSLKRLDIDYSSEKQRLQLDMQTAQIQDTVNMMKSFEDGFVSIAQSATKGAESVQEAFKNMGNAIMMELIAIEARILSRKIISQLFGVGLDGNQVSPGGVLGIGNAGRSGNQSGILNGLLGAIPGLGGATNNIGGNTTNNNNLTNNINVSGGLGGGGDKSTLSQIFNGIGGAIKGAFSSIG